MLIVEQANVLPREKIEGPPRDFLKVNPRPHPRPDQRPKTQEAAGEKTQKLKFLTNSNTNFDKTQRLKL